MTAARPVSLNQPGHQTRPDPRSIAWRASPTVSTIGDVTPGSTVDIARYGAGFHSTVQGRTARLVEEDGVLVATSETTIDNDDIVSLIVAGRGRTV